MLRHLNELRAQRQKLASDMQALFARVEARSDVANCPEADKGFKADEWQQWRDMTKSHDSLEIRIKDLEAIEATTQMRDDRHGGLILPQITDDNAAAVALQKRALETVQQRGSYHLLDVKKEHELREAFTAIYVPVFEGWARGGMDALDNGQRQIMTMMHSNTPQARAQGTVPAALGGFTIPETWQSALERVQKAFGGLLSSEGQVGGIGVIRTTDGGDWHQPTVNDTNNEGVILPENTVETPLDILIGEKILRSFTYSSRFVTVSVQLLNDTGVDLEGEITSLLGERLGRIIARHLVTGTGINQPTGITIAATVGKVAAGATSVTYNELLDLKHSVDPAYRQMGARWAFHDTTLLAIKKLADTTGLPLWQPNIALGNAGTIDADPFTIDNSYPVMATGNKTISYGNHNKYKVRMVRGINVLRLTERFADALQVGFLAFERLDADLVDGGGGAVKLLQQA